MEIRGRSYLQPVSQDDLKVGDRVRHVEGAFGTVRKLHPKGFVSVQFGRTDKVTALVHWSKLAFVRCV